MEYFEERLHRTLIDYLIDCDLHETAALLIDAEIQIHSDLAFVEAIVIDLPPAVYNFLVRNDKIKNTIKSAIAVVGEGHITDGNGNPHDNYEVKFRMKLLEVNEGWKDIVRNVILNYKNPNQGIISEKALLKKGCKPLIYNEMKFLHSLK